MSIVGKIFINPVKKDPMLPLLLFTGIAGDYLLAFKHIRVSGYDLHILPSFICVLVLAGIFATGKLLFSSAVYTAAQALMFSLSPLQSLSLLFFYLVVGLIAYVGLYSFKELFFENRLYLFSVFVVYFLAMLTMGSVSSLVPPVFDFVTDYTNSFVVALINSIIAAIIYLSSYLTHGFRLYEAVRQPVYQQIPWQLFLLVLVILIGNLTATYFTIDSSIKDHRRNLQNIYDDWLVQETERIESELSRILSDFENETIRLTRLPGTQYFYLELLMQRYQETFTRLASEGMEGIYLFNEKGELKLSVSGHQLDEGAMRFLREVRVFYSPAEYNPGVEKVFKRILVCDGEPVIVYIAPVYQTSKEPNKPESRPTNRRSGFLVMTANLRVIIYQTAGYLSLEHMFPYALLEIDSTKTVFTPTLESIIDRRSEGIIHNKLRSLPAADKVLTVELPAYDDERFTFDPQMPERYRIYQRQLSAGSSRLVVGMFYPESTIARAVAGLRSGAQLPVVYTALYELLMVVVLLAGAILINRRTAALLEMKIKETEEMIARRHQTFKELLNAIPMGIVLLTREGKVRVMNPRAVILLGGEREDISDTPLYPVAVKAFDSGTIQKQEIKHKSRIFDVIVITADVAGEKLAVMSFTDITETKKRQLASLVESKMMLIGEFASGFAHEVSNPLTIVMGNLELLANDPSLSEENRDLVRESLKAVKRASDITKSLVKLSFGTREDRTARIDLNVVVEKIIEFIEPNLKSNGIEPEVQLSEKPVYAVVNPSSIEQVLLNILLNAIEALKEHQGIRRIKVRTYVEAGFATVEITDTGPGIPEDIIDSIFDPFFSTREKGTGMGLYLAYHLVNEDKGEIDIDSTAGEGTTVRIAYPEARE